MKEELETKHQQPLSPTQLKQQTGDKPLNTEGQIIIEEKQNKPNGEVNIVQYVRGNFLGKVIKFSRYDKIQKQGGFAKCYEFTRVKDKHILAGKLILKSTLTKSRARQKLLSEIKIHRSLVHRNIVGFEHFFEDYESVYILLELCKSQSMNELLRRRKRLHELEVQCYTVQIVSALKYMHAHKVIHRDLKLGNLFLNDKMEVKIGDFGLATKLEFEGDRKRTICGTPNYIAPEILEGKSGHSYEVDIWSLGVIIYTLLIGKPPYETSDVKATYQKIKKNQYSFPEHVKISKQAKSLISNILQLDPTQRLTLDGILEHDFFRIGQAIPKHLPASTLACPPSENYIKQYWPHIVRQGSSTDLAKRMSETGTGKENLKGIRDGLMTERGGRTNTLSPSNPQIDKRISFGSKKQLQDIEWNEEEEPFIKQWIDYSNKYGVGYILTNEACGVYFNDNSKIILNPDNINLTYYEKDLNKVDQINTYTLKKYPQELKKKVTLLLHFKNYMQNHIKNVVVSPRKPYSLEKNVYVKKLMKTKHAILFRLSNKVVQVNFEDGTELIMSSITKRVSYLNKKGERFHYLLSTALDSENTEMIKRLNYARQVLEQTLKQQDSQPRQSALTQRAGSNQARAENFISERQGSQKKLIMRKDRETPEMQVLTARSNKQDEFSPQQFKAHQYDMIEKKHKATLGTAR